MSDTILELGQTIVARDAVIEDRNSTIESLNFSVAGLQTQTAQLYQSLEEASETIAAQTLTIGQKDNQLASAKAVSGLHCDNVGRRNSSMTERDDIISAKDVTLQARDTLITSQSGKLYEQIGTINTLNNVTGRQAFTVTKRNSAVTDRDDIITQKDKIIAERDSMITELLALLTPAPAYESLEYVESDGTFVYDLGIKAVVDGKLATFEMDYVPLQQTGDAYIGVGDPTDSRDYRFFDPYSVIFDCVQTRIVMNGQTMGERYFISLRQRGQNCLHLLVKNQDNGSMQYTDIQQDSLAVTDEYNMCVCGGVGNCYGTYNTIGEKMRLYSLKIYREAIMSNNPDTQLVMDLVPVKSDDVQCLYDKISGNLIKPVEAYMKHT